MALEDVSDLARDGSIASEVGRDEDCRGAEALGTDGGHCGSHTEGSGFVGGCADDGAVAAPGNDYGFAAERWVVALLDGGIEGVHVDVNDLADGHLWNMVCVFAAIAV